jgi:hypothetical protein
VRFIPEATAKGGSLVGNSYVAKFAQCPRDWFNAYYRPFEGSKGIRSRFTSEHLIKGRVFHEGIAALYKSGCRDGEDTGEWDLDLAVSVLELEHTAASVEYESEEKAEEDLLLVRGMLINYHDEFGPNGNQPDYPLIRVMHDGNGEPLVEREFSIDLGFGGYVFTCRADLLITHHGYPKIMEHKTSAPGFWATKRMNAIHTDSQFTGECFVLASLFPNEQIDGVLCNIVIKKGKTKIAIRESTRRSVEDFNSFRMSVLDILTQIDHRTEQFENDMDSGHSLEESVDRWFPDHGTRTGGCENYGGCSFQRLCLNKNRMEENLKSFVARTADEVLVAQERAK